jgi:hypothetical protein
MDKSNEVTQEQVEGVTEQIIDAMYGEKLSNVTPTEEELAEQQERLNQDRLNQWKWQNTMLLYPAILTGMCANSNVPDSMAAQVSMNVLKDALGKLYEFGQTL